MPCLNYGVYLLKELVPLFKLLAPLLKLLMTSLKCCCPFLNCWCTSKLRSPGDEPVLIIYVNFISDSHAAMSVFINDIKVGDTFSIREKADLLARFSTTDSSNFTSALSLECIIRSRTPNGDIKGLTSLQDENAVYIQQVRRDYSALTCWSRERKNATAVTIKLNVLCKCNFCRFIAVLRHLG